MCACVSAHVFVSLSSWSMYLQCAMWRKELVQSKNSCAYQYCVLWVCVFDVLRCENVRLSERQGDCSFNREAIIVDINVTDVQDLSNTALSEEIKPRQYSTQLLNHHHWPVLEFCCKYKIANLAYHHFDSTFPSYLLVSLWHTKHHSPSNPQARSVWKSLNAM